MGKDGGDGKEIQDRMNKGQRSIRTLNDIWWGKRVSKEWKVIIYNAVIISIVLHGAETWSKTEAIETDILRSCSIMIRKNP